MVPHLCSFSSPSQLLQSMWAVSCQLACLWPSSLHAHCLSHAYRVPYGMHVCDNVCLCLYSFFISLMCIVIPSLCVVSPHSLHSSPLRLFSFCPLFLKWLYTVSPNVYRYDVLPLTLPVLVFGLIMYILYYICCVSCIVKVLLKIVCMRDMLNLTNVSLFRRFWSRVHGIDSQRFLLIFYNIKT